MKKVTGYLRLMRPANLVTAVSDVLAGIAVSGYFTGSAYINEGFGSIALLCLSTVGLYGGGVVFNDVFDASLDRIERPERPIPSGIVSKSGASTLGAILLATGISAAFFLGSISGALAVSISFFALLYDKWGKHFTIFGPLNMGFCRGLNLLLGISIIPEALNNLWFLAFVPVIYISSITMISRGEVHGSNRSTIYASVGFYAIVVAAILYFSLVQRNFLSAVVFLLPFSWMIFTPLFSAIKEPSGKNIGKAVKAGVIALILMNAGWAAAFGEWKVALAIVLLLPISLKLGKVFAVT